MTPKQILDSFSETLTADDRILSEQERALLTSIVQHAHHASATSPQLQEAARGVINSAVGEIVAQRAFSMLGGSVVERILQGTTLPATDTAREIRQRDPQSPHPSPPGVKALARNLSRPGLRPRDRSRQGMDP